MKPDDDPSSDPEQLSTRAKERRLFIPYIVIGLLFWGGLLAYGAYAFQGKNDFRKPLIVLACVGVFVGFWGIMIWANRGRLRHDVQRRDEHNKQL